jgi:YD repeat-containing protein
MMDWNGTVNFALDLLGRITSVNDQNSKVTTYTYDPVGNQTSMKYPDNSTVSYTYDLLGRLVNVKDGENQNTSYTYDRASRLLSQVYPNGWKENYTYDAANQLTRQYTTDPSSAANKAVERTYSYDPQGNILTEYRNGVHGMDRYNLAHTYDALNRLTGTTGDQGYKAHAYSYDSLGNLIRETVQNKSTEYWYNNLNQQVQKKADNKDTYTYTFDKRGNLVKGIYQKNQNTSYT